MLNLTTCALTTYALLACAVGASPQPERGIVRIGDTLAFQFLDDAEARLRFTVPTGPRGERPDVAFEEVEGGWWRVRIVWHFEEETPLDELAVAFSPAFEPDFWWAPHLAPNDGDCIAQHVFRAPALIAAGGSRLAVLVPDLDLCGQDPARPWFMDLDAPVRRMTLGLAHTEIVGHVHYRKKPGLVLGPGEAQLGFFLNSYVEAAEPPNPWGRVSRFLWNRWGRAEFARMPGAGVPLDTYVEHTYRWAFDTWRHAVWQEFEIDDRRVGAPAFIVNVTESPNYPGEPNLREFLSIWNQAWFSSLRSASGLFRYARRIGDDRLAERARLTKELALAAPVNNGIFPSVYRTEMTQIEIDGKPYNRSKGWETGHWTSSGRCPWERGVTDRWYHVLDASWTALLMLRWHEELEPDPRLLAYAEDYGRALLGHQDEQGFFPGWLHPESLEPAEVLRQSPETSLSVTFLLELARRTGNDDYRRAAVRAMDAVLETIVPEGRWEDFETYWSCNPWGKREFYGQRIPRNAMYKQNTFCMFWTAEALLETWRAVGDPRYLAWGRRTLDELSMAQQVWQPPFIYVPALGGFGVMNFDGEWNDARQSLFAELFMQYYRETGEPELFERGVAALRASFIMMHCPENPEVLAMWRAVWPFFGPEDYGFTMENYGHGGATSPQGEGMGSFTIYDWGNGAAAEARNRIRDRFGDVYIDRPRHLAFGIDAVHAQAYEGGFRLVDRAGRPRDIRIVFEDATSTTIHLDGSYEL